MNAKKIILGVAAGVVAGIATKLILKKTGHWNSFCEKASDIEDRFLHKGSRKKERDTLDTLPKGEEKTVTKVNYDASKKPSKT